MTEADYYDYAPTVALSRPVVCVGHPGSKYREIVYDLAALTGLPLHDLDRRVEHDAGQNLWSYAQQHGRQSLHELETTLLPGMLAQAPPGLVVLGEGALMDRNQHELVATQASLVFFQLPLATCYWALRRRAEQQGGMLLHPWLPDHLDNPQQLQSLYDGQQPALAAADHVVDLTALGVHEAVLTLKGMLPGLGAADVARE